jgi:TRAP-type C4-dicarboxylate transport system permease large subunit
MAGMAKDVPMTTMFKGVTPFVIAMVVCVVVLLAVPEVALFLPRVLK